jgi:hypothetical protein
MCFYGWNSLVLKCFFIRELSRERLPRWIGSGTSQLVPRQRDPSLVYGLPHLEW